MFRWSFLSVGVCLTGLTCSLPAYAFETAPSSAEEQETGGWDEALENSLIFSNPYADKSEIHPTKYTYFKAGVGEVSPVTSNSSWQPGQYYNDEGKLGVAETGFRSSGKDQIGMGGWEYTETPTAFTPPDKKSIKGMYVLAERSFYNEDDKNIMGFARVGRSAGNLEQTKNGWSTGFIAKGFVSERPDGQFGLAISGGSTSKQRNLNNTSSMGGMETRLELTYQDKISDNVTIQPGLSFNISGSDPSTTEGLVGGLRLRWRFK
ncbi:MAG: carbohydrate porin [Alphaproteobacteria bacterium]